MSTSGHSQELRDHLRQLVDGHPLTEAQAWQAFETVMAGQASEAQIGALLAILTTRPGGPTADEITGAARAMRNHALKIDVPPGVDVVDTCGTGGAGSVTFNISTTAALIAAGAGAHVAKHGNRSVTSRSGSSQVLEALGVKLNVGRNVLTRCLSESRICFCFAPLHHPAMKNVAAARQELGFRTIFNLLGPLTNPAGATRQVIGVNAPELTDKIARVLIRLGVRRAMVVYGRTDDRGLGELTTTGPTHITDVNEGVVSTMELTPQDLGLPRASLDQLRVESVEESAQIVRGVLEGRKGPARDIAVLNAGAALVVAGLADDLAGGMARASQAIDAGSAAAALNQLVHITNHG